MAATTIEWTDATWNPVAGCTAVSPGCDNCYAARMAARLAAMGLAKYRGLTLRSANRPAWPARFSAMKRASTSPFGGGNRDSYSSTR